MPRLTPSLTCAALLCAATPAFAASEGARIEGTWMAIGIFVMKRMISFKF